MKQVRGALAAAVGMALVMAGPASAATINVETKKDEFGAGGTNKCALREAVQSANGNQKFGGCNKGTGADKIVLGAGVYKLSINEPSTEDENIEGDIDVTGDTTITGKGAAKTALDGNAQNVDERIFHLNDDNLTISGVTLRNARELYDDGGAAWNSGSGRMTIRNSRVTGNYSGYRGGGLSTSGNGGDLIVIRTMVANNSSGSYGGGLAGHSGGGDVIIRNSKVLDNIGVSTGAVISGTGKFVLANSVISGNTAYDYSGAIDLYNNTSTLVKNSTISGNRVTYEDYGGGIYDESTDGPVRIENSTISNNYSGSSGGGIYAQYDTWTIRNSTISANQAMSNGGNSGYGGGIYNNGAEMTLQSVTLAYNTSYDGAGIYADSGSVALKNSIIARNRNYDQTEWTPDCVATTGTITSQGHNLVGDGSCNPIASDLGGDSSDQLFPGLDTLANNGGPTKTHALLAGSPAINKGQGCPARDQRGRKRTGRCDIGAFEK